MSAVLRRGWSECRDCIEARTARERVLMLITMMVIMLASGHFLVLSPMDRAIQDERQAVALKQSEIDAMRAASDALVAEYQKDSDAANRARLAELRQTLARSDAPLTRLTEGMVAPEEMAQLVEGVLVLNRRLELVDMRNLPPEALFDTDTGRAGEPAAGGRNEQDHRNIALYKHGLEISVEGRYTEIVQFLQTLEDLPWKVSWGDLRLETLDYPVSQLVLVIYTFSLREPWLQV